MLSLLFTGRTADIESLDEQWQDAESQRKGALLVVSGTAGVGKSALAMEWLRTRESDFPDGQLYADLRGYSPEERVGATTVLAGFLQALGLPPAWIPDRLADQVAALRTVTHSKRICVLLDNAVTAAQVRTLALTSPGCATVVTTRDTLSGLRMDGAWLQRLEPWRPETGLAFFEKVLGAKRVSDEPRAALRVAQLCGGLPLALGVAAARLASRPRWTVARLAEDLERDGQRLEVLSVGEDSAVTPVLDGSYQVLASDDARLYCILGACPVTWFDLDMVAALLDCDVRTAEARIDVLVDANLLEDLRDRYRFHDLVRLHARQCATMHAPPEELARALGRLFDFFLHTATSAEELLTPSHRILERTYLTDVEPRISFDEDAEALNWLDRQKPNLMMVLHHCAQHEMHTPVWQLVDAMWPLFLRRRYTEIRLEAQRLAVAAAVADGNEIAHASALTHLAGTLSGSGQLNESADYTAQALHMYELLGDERGQAQALNGLAKIFLEQEKFEQAEQMFNLALALRIKIRYRRGVYLTYQGLGKVAAARGDSAAAAGYLRRSYHGLIVLGDRYDAAWSLALWASLTAVRGLHRTALRRLDQAEALMAATGSARGQGGVLEIAGNVLAAQGDTAAAREKYTAAADLFAAADPGAEARIRSLAGGPPRESASEHVV